MENTRLTIDTFLRDLGLNEKETEIYMYLAKKGPQKALSIAKSLRTHKMQVYRYLEAMQKKEVVSLTFETPKRFVAVPIEKLVKTRMLSLKEKLLNTEKSSEKILNYSGFSFPTQDQLSTFSIVQGKEKAQKLISDLINKAAEEICVVAGDEELGKLVIVKDKDESGRAKTKLSRYIIKVSTKDRANLHVPFLKNFAAADSQLHITVAEDTFPSLAVADDKEAVLVVEESSTTVLWTDNPLIVCVVKGFFEKLWIDTGDMLPNRQALRDS